MIDGELVALDEVGRPSFSALQNGGAGVAIFYYVFDVMVLGGRNVMSEALAVRRDLLTGCHCSPIQPERHHGSTPPLPI